MISPFSIAGILNTNYSVDSCAFVLFVHSEHKVTLISILIFPVLEKICLFLHSILR